MVMLATPCPWALSGSAHAAAPSERCEAVRKEFPNYSAKNLTIALIVGYPGLASQVSSDPHGWVGFIPDITQNLADCLGFNYALTAIDFGGLVPAIQQHRFDFSIPNAYLTAQRLAVVRFIAYISAAERVIVQRGNPRNVKSTLDLCGLTGTTLPGGADALILQSLTQDCEKAGKPAIVVQSYSMGIQDFQAVADGHADFHIDGEFSMSSFNTAHPGLLDVILDPFPGAQEGMMFPQDSVDLVRAIHAAIRAIQQDGVEASLIKKWNLNGVLELEAFIAPPLP